MTLSISIGWSPSPIVNQMLKTLNATRREYLYIYIASPSINLYTVVGVLLAVLRSLGVSGGPIGASENLGGGAWPCNAVLCNRCLYLCNPHVGFASPFLWASWELGDGGATMLPLLFGSAGSLGGAGECIYYIHILKSKTFRRLLQSNCGSA